MTVLPPSTPDLIALDLLDSIAELGSLGRAASRHRMSQPAVSMRMTQLERRLGVTLLQRGPAGARLTPAGERVVSLSRRVLSETQELMAGVDALVAEARSHLRVAASLTVAEYLLPSWLATLHRKAPDAILAAARRGEGPAVLSDLAVADDLDTGRLVAVPTEGIRLARSLRAVWPTGRPLPTLAADLLSIASS